MDLKQLTKELNYKWRVQSCKFGKANCVAYIDARDAQDLLDEVCGADNWSVEYYHDGNLLFCKVGIFVNDKWIYKSDTGSESNIEKNKGHVSDAFKRACVAWGIGRFLYRLPIQVLKSKEYKTKEYPYAPEKDKIIFDGVTLTNYINWKLKK